MQSPNTAERHLLYSERNPREVTEPAPDTEPNAEVLRTKALGCMALLGVLLVLPVICAVLFYFVSVAAQNYWAMVASVKGVF